MCGATVMLGNPLLPRSRAISTKKQPVPNKSNRRNGTKGRIRVYKLQSVVPTKEIEALSVNELRVPENAFARRPGVGGQLLVNPHQPSLDEA